MTKFPAASAPAGRDNADDDRNREMQPGTIDGQTNPATEAKVTGKAPGWANSRMKRPHDFEKLMSRPDPNAHYI